jgi:hypothetical protein
LHSNGPNKAHLRQKNKNQKKTLKVYPTSLTTSLC